MECCCCYPGVSDPGVEAQLDGVEAGWKPRPGPEGVLALRIDRFVYGLMNAIYGRRDTLRLRY